MTPGRALITGATSFIGRELAGALLAEGVEVHAVVRPDSELSRFDILPRQPACHVHQGGAVQLAELVAGIAPDAVFHLAGTYLRDHGPAELDRLVADNLAFGAQLLEATARSGCRVLVTAGSYFQYMDGGAPRPLNLYAAAKQAFEALLAYYRDAFGLKAATLVIFDTYGPGDWRPKLMGALRDAVLNGAPLPLPAQDPELDFVFAADVAAAFIQAARGLGTGMIEGGSFAVTGGERIRLSALAALFAEIGGRPIDTRPGAWAAPARGVEGLWNGPAVPGWTPKVTLREGIRRMLEG